MGAPIVTLAVSSMIEKERSLRNRIPFLILVHPALFGAPGLQSLIMEESAVSVLQSQIGRDLAFPDRPFPAAARKAVTTILDAGIAVAVVYSSLDEFTPYWPLDDERIYHLEMSLEGKERRNASLISKFHLHQEVQKSPEYHKKIYQLSRPVVTLLRRPRH